MSLLVLLIACSWGAFAALPIISISRKSHSRSRAKLLVQKQQSPRAQIISSAPFLRVALVPARKRAERITENAVSRDIPVFIDLLALAAASGCTPARSVEAVAPWAPPMISQWCSRLGSANDRGITFAAACLESPPHPALQTLGAALGASALSGAPILAALQRLAESSRTSTRQAAEARARAVPIRLLFPLVFTILPAFGLLTLAPVVIGALAGR